MSTPTVYVPRDSAALAAGIDEVAAAIVAEAGRRKLPVQLVRNGSRGLFWLEPLVEVAARRSRRLRAGDAGRRAEALFEPASGRRHALGHGAAEQIPFLALQERLTFRRMGVTDPLSLADYEAHDGWAGLRRATPR